MHVFILEFACPEFSTVVGYQRSAAASNGERFIPCSQSTPVLRMVQTMLYTGDIVPCSEGRDGNTPFNLRTLSELFMFTQQFDLLGWLASFELFLNAAIIFYGLGASAMLETQTSYNEFLAWLRVVQPVGIKDAVALGCLTYSHTRWGSEGVHLDWLLAAMERLEYRHGHAISARKTDVPTPTTVFKSIGVATSGALAERLRSHTATSDVAGPEIRIELNVSDHCPDCQYYKDILGKSFFECLTTEACCQNVEICKPCLALHRSD
jgi:hypothetical protein